MVASDQKHTVRVGQLQSQQRVEDFHSVGPAIRVISEEHHLKIGAHDREIPQAALLVQPGQVGEQRPNIAVEIGMEKNLAALGHDPLLRERLEGNGGG